MGKTPLNAPSASTSNNFEIYGEGDVGVVKSLDNDWSDAIISLYGSSELYAEATSWRQEQGVLIFAVDDSKLTFNGSNLELYGGGGYVASVRDSSNTTFNFDRITCNGDFGFFVRHGSNPTFNGNCVVTANVIKGTNNCQTLAIQRMGEGGRVVINSPIIETESWTLNTTQHSGGEAIINGNIFATTVNGKGIVAGLDSTGAEFTINGNITTDANTAFLGVGGVNSDWYFNGKIESLSGSSANPLLNFGSGSGSVNLNGSVKNTDGGTALNGISTGGVSIVVENLEVTADNETITSSSPLIQTVEVLHSLSINKPLNSNITTTGLYNYTGTTNVGDLVIYNTPINNESPNKVLTHNLDGSIGTTSVSGLTLDTYIVSGNADAATSQLNLTNNTGGTFTVTNSAALFSDNDINVTGGTYNTATGCVTFATNSGTTFDVCGFTTGLTDSYTTGATLAGETISFDNNINGLNYYDIDLSPAFNEKVDVSTFNNYTANTTDNFVTGATLTSNTLNIKRNNGLSDVNVDLSSLSASTTNLQNVLDQGSNATISSPLYIGVPGDDLTLFTGGVLDLSADESTSFFNNSAEITSQNGNLSFNANNGEINLSANDKVNVSSDLDVVGDVIVTGGTGNINSKQVYVEGNLALDWNFSNNSISLGNSTDSTLIKGSELFVDTNTFVDGNLSANTYFGDGSQLTGLNDIFVVSGNADAATSQLTFSNNTGGTFSISNAAALFSDNDINVIGGTYNPTTGCVTFVTNSGTTFDVCGFVTGITDTYVTGGTYNSSTDTIDLTRTDSATVSITGVSDTFYWTTGSTGNYSIRALNDTAVDATGDYAVAEGGSTASGDYSHAEGFGTTSTGANSHAEGESTIASGQSSHAEGILTTAVLNYSHAEGFGTIASGIESHAEGYQTVASGEDSHAEGLFTTSNGNYSHAEGWNTSSSGEDSHAEGYGTLASGADSHAEGLTTTASETASHAEGFSTTSTGISSHAEGFQTTATGDATHSEGYSTIAEGVASHAEGFETTSVAGFSHAGGFGSIASGSTSFIHSTNSLASGERSAVLGGQNITGTTDDTVYVPFLNIKDLASGTSINNLGIDLDGNVVTGGAAGGEVNTASNLGSGEGLFAQKSAVDLEFKSLTSTGTSLSITSDLSTVNIERNNLVSLTSITSPSYSAITSDEIIGLDTTSFSPILYLPDSTTAGKVRYEIKDIGVNARTNPITIQASGSDTIITTSVVSSAQIFVDGGAIILVSTGLGQWWQM